MRVVAFGKNRELLETLRRAVHPTLPCCQLQQTNSTGVAIAHLIAMLRDQNIKVDLLVSCAGRGMLSPFVDSALDSHSPLLSEVLAAPL